MLAKAREIEEARRLEEEAKRKAAEEARRKVNDFLLFPVPWCILISKMELYLPEKIAQFNSKVFWYAALFCFVRHKGSELFKRKYDYLKGAMLARTMFRWSTLYFSVAGMHLEIITLSEIQMPTAIAFVWKSTRIQMPTAIAFMWKSTRKCVLWMKRDCWTY